MGGCCDDFVPGGQDGGGGGLTNAIQSISGGTAVATGPGVSFANSNNVSFGVSGNTVTASVVPDAGIGLAAGSQTMATGTAVFANSNGVTFGLSASTVTASVAAIKAISGGTTNATGTGVSFADGGGVSFGVSGNTVTASIASSLTGINVSAGTTSNNLSAITFADGSGVSFGLNGSTLTASIASSLTAINVSAGTTSNNLSAAIFSNSNNVSFGLNGSTITASAFDYTHSQYAPWVGQSLSFSLIGNSSLHVQPRTVPNLAFSQYNQLLSWANNAASTGTCSFTIGVGIYTKNVSTLSLVMSTTLSGSIPYSGAANDSINNGLRLVTTPWTSTLSRGDYFFGHLVMTATNSQNGTFRPALQHALQGAAFSGLLGSAQTSSIQEQLGLGVLSVQTAAIPNSIAFSDIVGSVINPPAIGFGATA